MLVDDVSDGTRMNRTVMAASGITASRTSLRKYLYAIAPNSAMQHAGFIRVTAPQDLADQIRDELKSALEKYE